MSEIGTLGVGIGALLVYVGICVFGILLALSPLLCWLNLRAIRKRQENDSYMLDEHLVELRDSVEDVEFVLGKILKALEDQKSAG